MFTGIIEAIGQVIAMQPNAGDLRLRIGRGNLALHDVVLGESIACNGVCLTVVAFSVEHFEADVSNETLRCTTLGALQVGSPVNLERAMRADGRFGGHLVSGHVDGVGEVRSITPESRSQIWRFRVPKSLSRYIAAKGSVCIDGTSLTVNTVEADEFEVNLVPHTLANTRFHALSPGAPVNIEVDLIARYVERLRSGGVGIAE